MQEAVSARTPAHLWIVGILSLLWNCFGGYDYVMTRMRNTDYIAAMTPASMRTLLWRGWTVSRCGRIRLGARRLGRRCAASILLLMRSRYAVRAFGLSLLGAVIGLGYQMAKPPCLAMKVYGRRHADVIIVVALGLFLYAWRTARERSAALGQAGLSDLRPLYRPRMKSRTSRDSFTRSSSRTYIMWPAP